MRQNAAPLWAIHALADNEAQIAAELGAQLLPIGLTQEVGCGGIGCVWHTAKEGVVFKLTTEAEEYELALAVMNMSRPPAGIARFYGAVELQRTAELDGVEYTVYGLWREWADSTARESLPAPDLATLDGLSEAYNTAVVDFSNQNRPWPSGAQIRDAARELSRAGTEQDARSGFVHPTYTVPELYVTMHWIEDMLKRVPSLRAIAMALRYFRVRQMLLVDVDEGNVGRFRRGSRSVYAIFDAHLFDYRGM